MTNPEIPVTTTTRPEIPGTTRPPKDLRPVDPGDLTRSSKSGNETSEEWQGPRLTPAGIIESGTPDIPTTFATGNKNFLPFHDEAAHKSEKAWNTLSPAQERRLAPQPTGILAEAQLPAHATPDSHVASDTGAQRLPNRLTQA